MPNEEDLLPSLFYARDKYLSNNGILIPHRAKMEVVPVYAPDYFDKHIAGWSEPSQYINFGLVREFAANNIYYDDHIEITEEFLAKPAEILDLDFMTASKADCQNTIEVKIIKDGVCHGWLGWFRSQLGNVWLSTSPLETRTHWNQAFLPLDPPLPVKIGDVLSFQLKRPEFGEWTWTVETPESKQRHSTFLSRPISPTVLQKKSDNHKGLLSIKGQIALHVLRELNGNKSTSNIATEIAESYALIFPDYEHAKRFVIDLIERFT